MGLFRSELKSAKKELDAWFTDTRNVWIHSPLMSQDELEMKLKGQQVLAYPVIDRLVNAGAERKWVAEKFNSERDSYKRIVGGKADPAHIAATSDVFRALEDAAWDLGND